ncbi:MAG: 2-phosphosulfolactate phosphatase, partial [Deltaproteobacteria bacterium]|nr:2-phosphosulfolactate phosphatase [Deltaproteobacteria bacterium]
LATEHEALDRGAALGAHAILVGEQQGKRLPGFHCNNSPTELAAFDLDGKTVVITTTNGTKAVAACADAHRIFAGALTNAPALGRFLCARGELERDVAVVCAGRSTGALAFEDLLGAGAIVDAIVAGSPPANLWVTDGARVAHELFERYRAGLAEAVHSSDAARELVEQGGGGDVDTAGALGACESVPLLREGAFVRHDR